MKIIVSLDSQSVITQPASLRIKAGAFVPVVIAFTKGSQTVSLPSGAVIEFSLKPRTQWTGGLLAYLSQFDLTPGNLYTGALNCASVSLLGALGLTDSTPLNDLPQIEANAEVTWSIGGQKFRSSTFPVVIESPITDDTPIPTPDPELYPAPGAIALKSELPILANPVDAAAGTRSDVVMSPLAVSEWFNAKLPGTPGLAFLGDDSWGLPDLSSYTGRLAGDGTGLYNLSAQRVNSPWGASIYDAGFGNWQVDGILNVSSLYGAFFGDGANLHNLTAFQLLSPFGYSFTETGGGNWHLDGNLYADSLYGTFSGDGTNLYNLTALQLISPSGYSLNELGSGNWHLDGNLYADSFYGVFIGDGTSLSNLTALQLLSPFGHTFADSGGGNWHLDGNLYANAFYGDGTHLNNLTAFQVTSPDGFSIHDAGHGNWQVNGNLNANSFFGAFNGDGSNLVNLTALQLISLYGSSIYDSGGGNWMVNGNLSANSFNGNFSGDGSSLYNLTANQVSSPYGYSFYDSGFGNWQLNGSLNANWFSGSFNGDGSNLSNLTAYQLNSQYGYSIYDSGWGNWQVSGGINANWFSGSFNGDGSQLQNVYAQYANCDGNGNQIAYTYAQQWGYYGGLSVGNADWAGNCGYASYTNSADWANSSQYASYAYADNWGCQLFGAGNIQSYFFGGSPNPGDVATFDGNYWSPSPGSSLPITVATASDRFASSGLRTGWLVKQLDNRTVYQVLDPNDYATELGWVPVGPFILIPANSTPLVIDNNLPTIGVTINCTAGTWSDNPTVYVYQWNRNESPISGANALAYTVVAADDGTSLQCVVTATNAAGTGTDNATIPLVVLTAPVNTTAPTISPTGTPNVGDTLSLTGGAWTGYGYTTTYQWNRSGTAISGATAATYTLVAADAGQTITCAITRTNIRGAATVATAATPAVTNLIAANTSIPTLSSTLPFTGLVLTCSPGTWNYHPSSYGYQWKRSGVAISGATSSTYTVVSGDVGSTISCAVTATNVAGTSGAISTAESSAVTAAAVSPIQGSIASGLIAHWSLDEASGTRFDSTSNGINLTPYSNGGAITNAAGKFGMAANIPAHSYLAVTDSRLAATKTMCGWFKLSATATSYQRLLAGGIQIYGGSSGISWDNSHYSTGIVPAAGQWYFICMVSTGTTFKLWVNNQTFTVQNVTAGSSVIGSGIEIGDPSYESVAMLFDEVACWNRTLTDTEIMTLASA